MTRYNIISKISQILKNRKTTANKPQHNDFYIVEFPKSGITWLSSILANMALISSDRKEIASFTAATLYIPDIHITRDIVNVAYNTPPIRMIKSHAEFNKNYIFVIYLVRHPLDVMKSYYRFRKELGIIDTLSFDDFCHSKKTGIPAWKKHITSWLYGKTTSQRLHLCRYEDLLNNPLKEIELISKNFGWNIDLTVIEKAISTSSVDNMKEAELIYKSRDPKYTINFIRGEYDLDVKKETISYINHECKQILQLLGYTTDN